MTGEPEHQKAYEGVKFARYWLESTTRVQPLWDVYDHPAGCQPETLTGPANRYDMVALRVDADGNTLKGHLYVEVKNYDVVGRQSSEYKQFLAKSYSALHRAHRDLEDEPRLEFMWITWHPFDQTIWPTLTKEQHVRTALADKELATKWLGGTEILDDVVRDLARCLYLVVLSRKQDDLTMHKALLGQLQGHITEATRPAT